ncbi:10 kDa chaperonin [Mycobacterium kansasii 732]|nr:10 kDa chaperonin [Mycobacterium kansasii 732]
MEGSNRGEGEHQATRGQDSRAGQRGRDHDRVRSGHSRHRQGEAPGGHRRRCRPGRWDEDGEKRIPLDVAEGDTVIYSKYGGTEIKYNGEEYLILSARDVLAVVSK